MSPTIQDLHNIHSYTPSLSQNTISIVMNEANPKPKPTLQKTKEPNATAADDHKLQKEEDTPCKASADYAEEGDQAVGSCLNGGLKAEESGRERLKRHRVEVAGEVWIPDIWGQEDFLEDWIDCMAFDTGLEAKRIMSARAAMVEQGRRAHSSRVFSVENSC